MADPLVIIPTYNECENIETVTRAVMSLPQPFELLVVDDNSSDGTSDIVRNLMKEFPGRIHLEVRAGKLGLGTAYIHGFRWALSKGYDFVFEMDADMSHNPADLIRLYKSCKEDGNDLTIGSRYIKGVNVVNWPIGRVIMSYYASVYVRIITGMPVKDATAGFKCYRRQVLESIDLDRIRFMGYAFQIEMKFTAWKLGFKLKEVPIIFTDRQEGVSKMSTRIFREAFFGVIQMKVGSWFRKYQQKN
ncbi:MAG: polyprenol monophosphomannose synthase [Bacteroidota bacterium]